MRQKEKLLVIAPYVPRYDQNSGDLRLFSILEILSKKYEVTYLTRAGSRQEPLKDDKYISDLKNLGMTVFVKNYSLKHILRKNRFKVAILEFYFVAEYYLPRIRILQASCPVVIDSVDVHYLRERLKYQITGNEDDFKKALETRRRELNIYRKADAVIAVTEADANVLKRDCPNLKIEIIPNIHKLEISANNRQKNLLIFVGGFRHDPNIDAVLYFCRDILPLVKKEVPDIKLIIVGSHPPEEIKTLNNDFIKVTGYVSSTTPYLQESYISIAPLRYGAGMKGKIGEAMAHGLPVVTTSIGAQGMDLRNRENVMVADSSEEFSKSIIHLIQNNGLYKTIQNNSVEYIKRNFIPDAVEERIFAIFNKLENRAPKRMTFREKTSFLYNYTVSLLNKKLSRNTKREPLVST